MSKHLERELDELKKSLLKISSRVESAIEKSITALEKDQPDVAAQVVQEDSVIDQGEVEIEETCLKILALHQPVAEDLRFVAAIIRINNDLERIGDYAVSIAERVIHLKNSSLPPPKEMRQLALVAQQMVRDSIIAFVRKDADFARKICVRDDQADQIHRGLIQDIKKLMAEKKENIDPALDFFVTARRLERIADMATNIAQDVVYMVEGEIIRHRPEEYPR